VSSGRPRLLVVARDRYPPFRVDVTILFSKYLAPHFDIDWLMRREVSGPAEIERLGNERFLVNGKGGLRFLGAFGRHLSALWQVLRREYDIVQCRDAIIISFAYALAATASKTPFVYWMSFPIEESYLARARDYFAAGDVMAMLPRLAIGIVGRLLLYQVTLPLAQHVFVQSDRMRNDVALRGISAGKLTAVPMGVDTDGHQLDAIAPIEHDFYRGKTVILYVGTLASERRLSIPFAGVIAVMTDQPNVVLVVVGKATNVERAAVRSQFAAAGLDGRLLILDHVLHDQMLRYVKRADVCLSAYDTSPQLLTGTPTKLPEYLLMGRRVVANRHPDQDVVVNGAGLGMLTEFTSEGFEQAILAAIALGAPTDVEQTRARNWLRDNRNYRTLSERVAAVYTELLQ
jgi:glycosyltransferase involved in cell wall biosynthesis